MILEVNPESLRDIAAAIHAAHKKAPDVEVLVELERVVLGAIQQKSGCLAIEQDQAQALREALLQRAWDQRRTTEGEDYSTLADRIEAALDETGMPPEDAVAEPVRPRGDGPRSTSSDIG